jgi:hypothetical protein
MQTAKTGQREADRSKWRVKNHDESQHEPADAKRVERALECLHCSQQQQTPTESSMQISKPCMG